VNESGTVLHELHTYPHNYSRHNRLSLEGGYSVLQRAWEEDFSVKEWNWGGIILLGRYASLNKILFSVKIDLSLQPHASCPQRAGRCLFLR